MKVLLFALLALSAPHRGREPFIVHQVSTMVMRQYESPQWERSIQIKNPRARAVWVYIECESRLTVNPIGLAGKNHTTTIVLPDVPPGEGCVIHHWYEQRGTQSPKPWSP